MPRVRMERMWFRCATVLVGVGVVGCAAHRVVTTEFDEPPRMLSGPAPAYPDSLLQARIEGFVLVQARVDTNGVVDCDSVRVVRSTRPEFEAPAVQAVCAARFRPAHFEGRPTVALVDVPVRFEFRAERTDAAAATEAAAEAERLAQMGEIQRALDAFARAEQLDARVSSWPAVLWPLCWYGGVWRHAEEVVTTCDRLVALDPRDAGARDARGIVRALTGDFEGAIADFETVVAVSPSETQRAERAEWIQALRAGRNPLTPDVLEALRSRGR